MNKSPVISSTVKTKNGDQLVPRPPMAEGVCGPSQRAIQRAWMAYAQQREDRDYKEAMALMDRMGVSLTQPPLPLPAAEWNPPEPPDPIMNAEVIVGFIAGLAFSGLVAVALILGNAL